MRKIMKCLLSLILLIASSPTAFGQLYDIDAVLADSVQLCHILKGADGREALGSAAIKIPSGETVRVEHLLEGFSGWGVIVVGGERYAVADGDLVFSDKNPEGVEDIFGDTRSNIRHTAVGKFFYTLTPYMMIAALLLVSIVLMYRSYRTERGMQRALVIVTVAMLLASLLEITAFVLLRTDALWWCDPKRYSFFGAFFRVLPFAVFSVFQLFSIKLYMWMVTDDSENELSVKPVLFSVIASVPVALAVTVVCAVCGFKSSVPLALVTLGAFFATLSVGFVKAGRRNVRELGLKKGVAFTLFAIVWSIGAAIVVVGTVFALLKVFVQIVIVSSIIGVLTGRNAKFVPRPPKPKYYDSQGRSYSSELDRNQAEFWRARLNDQK